MLDKNIKLVVKRRFLFIESCSVCKGKLRRSDLKERFELSTAQATNDLGKYNELHPGQMSYNKSSKQYEQLETFEPIYFKINSNGVLKAIIDDLGNKEKTLDVLKKELTETRKGLEKYFFESIVQNNIGIF